MLVVVDSPSSASRVADALQADGAVVQVFVDASPPLLAIVAHHPAVEKVRSLAGVVEVRAPAPFLSTHAAGPSRPVMVAGVAIGGDEIVMMAGPCSVDDDDRLFRIASTVAAQGASVLRAGVTKARTNPWGWNGPGIEGLQTLAAAGKRSGLPVVSEVLSESDVDAFVEHVDLLQVGARNMQNTQLLRRLGRVRRPVLLKRGFGCTVEELLGAADHIMAGGNTDVILCERGIRTFEQGVRFSFDLSAFVLLRQRTRLPVVVDPSHAAGDARLVAGIARGAIAAGADGLLVEVHDDPRRARSDREQAMSLDAFAALVTDVDKIAGAVGRSLHRRPAVTP